MATRSLVAVGRKSDLYKQHQDLYKLIVRKLEATESLTLREAKQIWLNLPTTVVKDGVPHRVEYQLTGRTSEYTSYYARVEVPMTPEQVTERVLKWLTQSIGLLVVRGYLKVTPMLDVRQLPEPVTDLATTDPKATTKSGKSAQ